MSDLIKREDAIKAIAETIADDGDTSAWLYVAEDMLNGVPSADRPQGEWIEHKERTIVRNGNFVDFFPTEYECSNCGLRRATYFINSPLFNYCPNCGCRMKGADDGRNAD
jgi:predicted RNA-binding Zn-ribbon protein involved in translation (DUF1610 family)